MHRQYLKIEEKIFLIANIFSYANSFQYLYLVIFFYI